MKRFARFILPTLVLLLLPAGGCATAVPAAPVAVAATSAPTNLPTAVQPPTATAATGAPVRLDFEIVAEYPHDTGAWTQGLVVASAQTLFEGTGDWENSRLREVELSSGRVLREVTLPEERFYGEGIALLNDQIFQITWQDGFGLIYNRSDFSLVNGFRYPPPGRELPIEGWGLTTDGTLLYMSDGSATIYVVDPAATASSGQLTIVREFSVTLDGRPVRRLNELEYVDGVIFANVWQEDVIVRFHAQDGRVTGVLDLSELLPAELREGADVLNGIAYDSATGLFYVTGKHWPRLYALRILE